MTRDEMLKAELVRRMSLRGDGEPRQAAEALYGEIAENAASLLDNIALALSQCPGVHEGCNDEMAALVYAELAERVRGEAAA